MIRREERKSGTKEQSKEKGRLRLLLLPFLLAVGAGILVGASMVAYLHGIYGELNGQVMVIIYCSLGMCLLSTFLNILFHEAGHLIFGLLTGYSFLSFRIASLTIVRDRGKLRIRRFSVPGTAGQCLMAPPVCPAERFPYRLYNYGGVIMNLIVTFLTCLSIFILPQSSVHGKFLLGGFAAGSLLTAVMNGLPTKAFGLANDGYHGKAMKRDPLARMSFRLQLEMIQRQASGERLKDMPEEWFLLPSGALPSNIMNAYILYIGYCRALDGMDFAGATERLIQLITITAKLPVSFRNMIQLEGLFLTLLNGASEEETKQYLTKQSRRLLKSIKNEINVLRIAYTYNKLYLKDEETAEVCKKRLLKLAGNYPIKAEAEMNLMLLEYVEHQSETGEAHA